MNLTCNLSSEQFDEFIKHHELNHYMKTSMWAALQDVSTKPFFIGFEENNTLIGTALALKKKWFTKTLLYIPWGPCIDYSNEHQLKEAISLLKDFAKKESCFLLRIDFNILRVSRSCDGEQIEGVNNENITELLISNDFKHKGYGYAYNGSWTNRYTLIADLSKPIEDIFNSYAKARQTAIRRHALLGVTTRIGNVHDIDYLMEFEKELTQTQGFKPHTKKFFTRILQTFAKNARLYITEVDLDTMIQSLDDEIHSKKYAKDKEALTSKQKELVEVQNLQRRFGDRVVIAAGLFIYNGSSSWDLYTYNKKDFGFVKPVDNLHYFAMQDMKSNGVLHYDMCGFSGVTDKRDPYYGLYSYKKSFGSSFTEYIGEFDYILENKSYIHFKKQLRFAGRCKRKLHTLLYLRK